MSNNDVSRRNFLKGASALGAAGVVATAVPGCSSGARSPQATSAGAPPPPVLSSGTWKYEPGLYRLTMNLGAVPLAGCAIADGSRTFKVRGLFNDMMYLAIEGSGGRLYLQQWVRTAGFVFSGEPTMAGTWINNLGHTLTLTETATDEGTTAVSQLGGCSGYGYLGQTALESNIFLHGVASGDPSDDGFILWTRAAKDNGGVAVTLEVAGDAQFTAIVHTQTVNTTGGIVGTDDGDASHGDHIAKIDLRGSGTFNPRTTYYYRFRTAGELDSAGNPFQSLIGRVKTLPAPSDTAISQMRVALVSCSSFPHGFFNAYRQAARHDDLDGVMHMGDYIYEYPGADGMSPGNSHDYPDAGAVRMYEPDNQVEMVSLEQYRRRFRDYRRDIDLQMIHTRYWFINTWDDHETVNDSWDDDAAGPNGGAENHNDTSFHSAGYTIEATTDFNVRKANAAQAYNEWLPVNDLIANTGDYQNPELHRTFSFGKLAEIIMLDTRVGGRAEPILDPNGAGSTTYSDPRPLMSTSQFNFMTTELTNAQVGGTKWKLLGQQVMMGHLVGPALLGTAATNPIGTDFLWNSVINPDQWDGYNDEREKVFSHVMPAISQAGPTPVGGIENFVVLTGDIHTSWAIELVDDPRQRAPSFTPLSAPVPASAFYGVEFVTPSVTSPGLPDPGGVLTTSLQTNNQHIKYSDLVNRGFSILEVTDTETNCTWYHMGDDVIADVENETVTVAKKFKVNAGQRNLVEEPV